MVSSAEVNFRSRDNVLEELSRSHLVDALQASSADAGAANAAFQAGYFALISSLSQDEVGSYQDHPNVEAAILGARRLGLTPDDLEMAGKDAADYYSPAARSDQDFRRQLEWARRARVAAGWAE